MLDRLSVVWIGLSAIRDEKLGVQQVKLRRIMIATKPEIFRAVERAVAHDEFHAGVHMAVVP